MEDKETIIKRIFKLGDKEVIPPKKEWDIFEEPEAPLDPKWLLIEPFDWKRVILFNKLTVLEGGNK